jgi:hypothetical protein
LTFRAATDNSFTLSGTKGKHPFHPIRLQKLIESLNLRKQTGI